MIEELPIQEASVQRWQEETIGLCPECLRSVPALLMESDNRIWIEQQCPRHGVSRALIASNASEYLRLRTYVPPRTGGGCCGSGEVCGDPGKPPVCVLLIEITRACNLRCPTCYADAQGHDFEPLEAVQKRLDRFFRDEQKRIDILMISGGEPTIHPQFAEILDLALSYPVERILVNTNGLRIAQNDVALDAVAERRRRAELYLSLSSFEPDVHERLYGRDLRAEKISAVERAKAAGIFVTVVATVENGVNDGELGALYKFCLSHENVNGLTLQPVMDTGRYTHRFAPQERTTMTGVIDSLSKQTSGALRAADFVGLPCSHPDCCALTYGFLDSSRSSMLPLPRELDVSRYMDLFADRISFSGLMGSAARRLLSDLLTPKRGRALRDLAGLLSHDAVKGLIPLLGDEAALGKRIFRIVIKPFMDAHTYDFKRIDQCCTKILDDSGRSVSFCEYNVFQRGRAPQIGLVPLTMAAPQSVS